MRKLTYWCCRQEHDHDCYNIRARTRKEAARQRAELCEPWKYTPPFKVTVQFRDAFDLLFDCLGEGGACEYPPDDLAKKFEKRMDSERRKARRREAHE